jgi:hypothetical protein
LTPVFDGLWARFRAVPTQTLRRPLQSGTGCAPLTRSATVLAPAMTTTMTRQQLVGLLVSLCTLSLLFGVSFMQGFYYWLRSDPLFWAHLGIVIVASLGLAYGFRKILRSIQTSPSAPDASSS